MIWDIQDMHSSLIVQDRTGQDSTVHKIYDVFVLGGALFSP